MHLHLNLREQERERDIYTHTHLHRHLSITISCVGDCRCIKKDLMIIRAWFMKNNMMMMMIHHTIGYCGGTSPWWHLRDLKSHFHNTTVKIKDVTWGMIIHPTMGTLLYYISPYYWVDVHPPICWPSWSLFRALCWGPHLESKRRTGYMWWLRYQKRLRVVGRRQKFKCLSAM